MTTFCIVILAAKDHTFELYWIWMMTHHKLAYSCNILHEYFHHLTQLQTQHTQSAIARLLQTVTIETEELVNLSVHAIMQLWNASQIRKE